MPNELAGLVVLDVDRIRTCWWPIPRPGRQPSLDVLRPLQPLEADQGSCTKVWVPHFLESLGKRIGLLARCRLDFNAGVDALQTLERIRCVKKIGYWRWTTRHAFLATSMERLAVRYFLPS